VAKDFTVLEVYRRYKQFKPQGIAELNEGGQKLAHAIADEIAAVVDGLAPGFTAETAESAEKLGQGVQPNAPLANSAHSV
jgi:hypothetical protein